MFCYGCLEGSSNGILKNSVFCWHLVDLKIASSMKMRRRFIGGPLALPRTVTAYHWKVNTCLTSKRILHIFFCSACIYVYMFVCVHMCACAREGQRSTSDVFLSRSAPYCLLRQGLSLKLDITDSARLADQWVPPCPCQCWGYRHALHYFLVHYLEQK